MKEILVSIILKSLPYDCFLWWKCGKLWCSSVGCCECLVSGKYRSFKARRNVWIMKFNTLIDEGQWNVIFEQRLFSKTEEDTCLISVLCNEIHIMPVQHCAKVTTCVHYMFLVPPQVSPDCGDKSYQWSLYWRNFVLRFEHFYLLREKQESITSNRLFSAIIEGYIFLFAIH